MPVNALDSLEWCGSRSQNPNRIRPQRIQKFSDFPGERCSADGIPVCNHNAGESREGRIEHRLPISRLTRVEILKPLCDRQLKCVVIRKITLDHDLTGLIAASRATGDLREQLKGSLSGSK